MPKIYMYHPTHLESKVWKDSMLDQYLEKYEEFQSNHLQFV